MSAGAQRLALRRLARCWLAGALLAGAVSACSACASEPTPGGGASGGGGADGGASSSSSATSSSSTSSSCDPWPAPHPPDPEGKIDWEGWTTHPWLPSCCHGIYLPDDLALRVPPLSYKPCPGEPAGCQQIDASAWHWNDNTDEHFGGRLEATGAGPQWLVLAKKIARGTYENVLYGSDGQPIAAWREDGSTLEFNCGTFKGVAFDTAGTITLLELGTRIDGVMRQGSFVAAPAELGSLAVPQILKEEPGGLSAVAVSSELVAWNSGGGVRAGRVATGEIWYVGPGGVPGADGNWAMPKVVGDAVFAWEKKKGIWVHRGGVTAVLRDAPATGNILGYGSDGQTLVWVEGLDPQNVDGDAIYSQVTLYSAPFTTDPAALAPSAVAQLPNNSDGLYSGFAVANGYTVIPYGWTSTTGVPAARLVRLSDGAQWEVAPPEGQNWRLHYYPAAEHVWMTTGRSPGGAIVTDITRLAIAELEPLP